MSDIKTSRDTVEGCYSDFNGISENWQSAANEFIGGTTVTDTIETHFK